MDEHQIKEIVNKYDKPFVHIEYSWKEIGRTQEWFDTMKKTMSERIKVKRELLLEWTKTSENSIFSEEEMDEVGKYIKEIPEYILKVNGYEIKFYERPDVTKRYILGCDVSGGTQKDNSVITFIDPDDFHVVGDFKLSKIDTEEFKILIATLMKMYFTNAILVIERNSFGKNILDAFMKDPHIEPRLYRDTCDRDAEKKMSNGVVLKQKTKTLVYGIDTTNKSRPLMFELLYQIVKNEPQAIVSPELYTDIKNLVELPNGRIEADSGLHDDNVMSYLIVRYAIAYGKFLKQRFGIHSTPKANVGTRQSSAVKTAYNMAKKLSDDAKYEVRNQINNDQLMKELYCEQDIVNNLERTDAEKARTKQTISMFAAWNTK